MEPVSVLRFDDKTDADKFSTHKDKKTLTYVGPYDMKQYLDRQEADPRHKVDLKTFQ